MTIVRLFQQASLEGIEEFDGKHLSFLCQVLCADPIGSADGFARLGEKPADLFNKVMLSGGQPPAEGGLKILFGNGNGLAGLPLMLSLLRG